MDNIKIADLTGALQKIANANDENKNGYVDGKEISVFEIGAKALLSAGSIEEKDYNAIFGLELKNKNVEPPKNETKNLSKAERKAYNKNVNSSEDYLLTILKEEFQTSPENLKARLHERIGENANDPIYQQREQWINYVIDLVTNSKYNSKEDVENLYDNLKKQLQITRKDDFEKDVLKLLVKNAEYTQRTKEFGKVQEAYDKAVGAGTDWETAFEKVKDNFKKNGSYYKDIVNDFEDSYIMPKARTIVREAIYESDATSSRGVKKDAKEILKSNGNWNKYTKKALGGENNFGQWISGHDSDMKISRKNQARKNIVIDIRENGLTGEEVHDAVDKRKTFLFFKKKTQLFAALTGSGLIKDLGNGRYDISPLSELIGLHVGSNYKMDRTSSEYKALAEKTKTTSALAAATELKNLTQKEAEMLIKMCGYDVEGKDWGKAILGATIGALINGLGAGAGAATNDRYYYDTELLNNNYTELTFMDVTDDTLNELIDQFEKVDGAVLNLVEGGLKVIIDQQAITPLLWEGSRFIVETALKGAAVGAAFGLIAGLKDDDPEKPITSTQFKCTTLEEYAKVLDSEAKQKALKPQYKEALMLIAATFIEEDKDGNKYWDCEAYKMFLNKAAGNGGVLNREELLGALEMLKDEPPTETPTPTTGEGPSTTPGEDATVVPPKEEICYAEKGKEEDTIVDVKVPYITGIAAKGWKAAAKAYYPCLFENLMATYKNEDNAGDRAGQILKAAQAVTDGNYSEARLEALVKMSLKEIRNAKLDGINKAYYIELRNSKVMPERVYLPDNIANCDKKDNAKVGKADVKPGGSGKAPSTEFTGYKKKTADGREYLDFCDNSRVYLENGKTAEEACREKEAELKKQGKNVKVELRN